MDRYALRVTYKSPANINEDGAICSLVTRGTLCCVKENEETRSLVFEYVEHHQAVEDMRRVAAAIPNILSIIVYPKGFSCDSCCCFGSSPE